MSGHSSLEKYTSHFIDRVVCERWVGDWTKTATYWTPNSSGYNSISFPFSWAAQLGAWGPSLCLDMVLIPVSSLQLIWTSCRGGYIIIWRPPTSCEHHICTQFNPSTVKVIPWYLWLDAPVIYTGAFLLWQPGRVGGQYVTSWYWLEYFKKSWRCEETSCHTDLTENVQNIWQILNLITEVMKNQKVELTVGGKSFAEVKIQRGIF